MKPLPTKFTKQGFTHEQIAREGMAAIYERGKPGQHSHFEVIKIGHHDGYEVGGAKIEPAETYPSAEQFGTKAWTCADKERAFARFTSLLRPATGDDK